MIFLANRANLDTRTLLTRIHNRLQTQVPDEDSPIEQVRYQTSRGNKVGVHATVTPEAFLGTSYPVTEAELQVSFDFPPSYAYDFYAIQWVEPKRDLMIGWHQDETHADLGECHFQIDYDGETVQRETATFLDSHPLNVFDQRIDDLVSILEAVTWVESVPHVPTQAVR
ncbi:hypothetical protein G6M89_14275 [Natronolimnobius sp. AArcel1]|uniref:hypothetical protein n=1 Tax=Natronolimnobius sp. AArcel1 TaxID=1679093 RepID=UPI0013EB76C9|nr:hypothetical protein [Natronolimnobius sp. AArcel1]NGM70160.1 hypothetical protein [Natronolimnobius sp. AArcel1]